MNVITINGLTTAIDNVALGMRTSHECKSVFEPQIVPVWRMLYCMFNHNVFNHNALFPLPVRT